MRRIERKWLNAILDAARDDERKKAAKRLDRWLRPSQPRPMSELTHAKMVEVVRGKVLKPLPGDAKRGSA